MCEYSVKEIILAISNVTELPITAVKNSNINKLIQKGILGEGKSIYARTPKGTTVDIRMNDDGTLTKRIVNDKNHVFTSKFDVVEGGTRLSSVVENTPIGAIEQVYTKDGKVGGHIWTQNSDPWECITWGYLGNISNPTEASTVIHKLPYKNEDSIDAFKAAVNFIRGKGSLSAYTEQMAK